jgi:hypothetical protein
LSDIMNAEFHRLADAGAAVFQSTIYTPPHH